MKLARSRRLPAIAATAFFSSIGAPGVLGADWPRWLGPAQNGSTSADGALKRPSIKLRKAWRFAIGGGRGGIIISNGRVFALTTDGENQLAVALDGKDGRRLWQTPIGPHVDAGLAPVGSPAVDGDRVFVLGTDCILRSLSASTGEAGWKLDLKQRFGATLRRGCETSPFVDNGRLILQPGGAEDHRLVALDVKTGDLVWSAKGIERANYSSPVMAELAGTPQVVVHHVVAAPPQRSGLAGFRLSDGALLWSHNFEANVSTETPLAFDGDRVLLLSWNDAKVARVKRQGERLEAEAVWTKPVLSSRISPPVYRAGHLYGLNGDDLMCVRAETGDVVWKQKTYAGSLILVDDALVLLSATAGTLRIVEATPEGYKERASLDVLNRGAQTETPPSFASGMIFVRNDEEIAAIAIER